MRIITEPEFATALREALAHAFYSIGSVTGPGRSGAIAAVYASHILQVPFIPFGAPAPERLGALLLIDTATESGRTLRKAESRYRKMFSCDIVVLAVYREPPRVAFWYEAPKPQRYRHEREAA